MTVAAVEIVTLPNFAPGCNMLRAVPMGDKDTYEAEKFAKALHSRGFVFSDAYVDRTAGMVLVGMPYNVHFANALCGYNGSGPMLSQYILELFGFKMDHLRIGRLFIGGDKARCFFRR